MSAHDQMRAMLDQLMGTGRNGETSRYQVQFNDPKVCKSFLLYCCPHDILASTIGLGSSNPVKIAVAGEKVRYLHFGQTDNNLTSLPLPASTAELS
ncbi:Uncharacterized protein FWK35_00004807 [Aphis craccivora]|uniref:RNA-binding protein Luc7-like 2 n=1 Tax=Aphis craccivora TaxID=307492 RepID=A0A6G0ZJ07_APHCR|nr:Uncharacterized protein FWK35_00004807 [Aphis craccivora]